MTNCGKRPEAGRQRKRAEARLVAQLEEDMAKQVGKNSEAVAIWIVTSVTSSVLGWKAAEAKLQQEEAEERKRRKQQAQDAQQESRWIRKGTSRLFTQVYCRKRACHH